MLNFLIVVVIDIGAAWAWILFLKSRDKLDFRKRKVQWASLYFLGGIGSLFFSRFFYATNPFTALVPDPSNSLERFIQQFFVVAPSEELSKLLVFLLLAALSRSIREPLDAVLHAATVGLGFGIYENLGYGVLFGPWNTFYRSFLVLFGHMAFTALSGFACGLAIYWYRFRRHKAWIGLPLLGFFAAVFLHGLDNFLVYLRLSLLMIFIDLGIFFIFYWSLSKVSALSPYKTYPLSQWKLALSRVEHGLVRDPDNPALLLRQGIYKAYSGDWAHAKASFRSAAKAGGEGPLHRAYFESARLALGEDARQSLIQRAAELPERERLAFFSTMHAILRSDPTLSRRFELAFLPSEGRDEGAKGLRRSKSLSSQRSH